MSETTAIGAALAQAGLKVQRHQMRAFTAALDFITAGGSREEWIEVYDLVSARHEVAPPAAPTPEAVEPSPAEKRGRAKARGDVAKLQLTVFDMYLTHSGRRWGNVGYDELEEFKQDGEMAGLLKEHIGPLSGEERKKHIRDLVSASDFVAIANKAKVRPN